MVPMYPSAQWACISEGRVPLLCEIDTIAAKVRREAFAGCGSEHMERLARRIADVALRGYREPPGR